MTGQGVAREVGTSRLYPRSWPGHELYFPSTTILGLNTPKGSWRILSRLLGESCIRVSCTFLSIPWGAVGEKRRSTGGQLETNYSWTDVLFEVKSVCNLHDLGCFSRSEQRSCRCYRQLELAYPTWIDVTWLSYNKNSLVLWSSWSWHLVNTEKVPGSSPGRTSLFAVQITELSSSLEYLNNVT